VTAIPVGKIAVLPTVTAIPAGKIAITATETTMAAGKIAVVPTVRRVPVLGYSSSPSRSTKPVTASQNSVLCGAGSMRGMWPAPAMVTRLTAPCLP
jgi:hypothetical protein